MSGIFKDYFLEVLTPVRAHTHTIRCSYRELNSLDGFKENDKPLVQLAPFSKPGGRERISKLSGVSSHSE